MPSFLKKSSSGARESGGTWKCLVARFSTSCVVWSRVRMDRSIYHHRGGNENWGSKPRGYAELLSTNHWIVEATSCFQLYRIKGTEPPTPMPKNCLWYANRALSICLRFQWGQLPLISSMARRNSS